MCVWLTCALEFRVEQIGHRFEAQSERSVTPGQVAVGGEGRSGAGMAPQEPGQPGQVAIAQPLVLGQAQHSQSAQRLEQVARQCRQVVVVERPNKIQEKNNKNAILSTVKQNKKQQGAF